MSEKPLSIGSFPHAILHIDGDSFFASCEQSRNPSLKGKPVVTGKERGIASSMSYEAKNLGIKRGMPIGQIQKICPSAIFLPSDYETYSLLSKRFFEIVKRYTSQVEEYSIDECFADITGLRRPLGMSYPKIAESIKKDLDKELGFTFSVGLAPNKTIAKIGSKWKKPSGLTIIPGYEIHKFLKEKNIEDIWGIGPQTSAYLRQEKIFTALDFARKEESWIRKKLTKPSIETWQELNGEVIFPLSFSQKTSYSSIQKVKTFTPPSFDQNFVFSQLSKNIENACIKLRRHNLVAKKGIFFIKLQSFRYSGIEISFSRPTSNPTEIIKLAKENFSSIFDPREKYRATGIRLFNLTEDKIKQLDLFEEHIRTEQKNKLYKSIDEINERFGKHTVFLASSFLAHKIPQHKKERSEKTSRENLKLKGENGRQKIGIPMLMGEIS